MTSHAWPDLGRVRYLRRASRARLPHGGRPCAARTNLVSGASCPALTTTSEDRPCHTRSWPVTGQKWPYFGQGAKRSRANPGHITPGSDARTGRIMGWSWSKRSPAHQWPHHGRFMAVDEPIRTGNDRVIRHWPCMAAIRPQMNHVRSGTMPKWRRDARCGPENRIRQRAGHSIDKHDRVKPQPDQIVAVDDRIRHAKTRPFLGSRRCWRPPGTRRRGPQ